MYKVVMNLYAFWAVTFVRNTNIRKYMMFRIYELFRYVANYLYTKSKKKQRNKEKARYGIKFGANGIDGFSFFCVLNLPRPLSVVYDV